MALQTTEPLGKRIVNSVGGVLGRAGWGASLDPDGLLATARRRTGLDDIGDPSFREGLDRLQLIAHRGQYPAVAEERIDRPIFVLGLPRTGTTVLYGLLAANPAMRTPTSWEVGRPFPPPTSEQRHDDPRIRQVEREFDQFRRMAPDLDRIHPLGATLPQECLSIHALACRSYEFVTTFPVPRYWDWLRDQDLREAYELERQFLQHLQWTAADSGLRRWSPRTQPGGCARPW